jgi:hypothetical protein
VPSCHARLLSPQSFPSCKHQPGIAAHTESMHAHACAAVVTHSLTCPYLVSASKLSSAVSVSILVVAAFSRTWAEGKAATGKDSVVWPACGDWHTCCRLLHR